MERKRFIKSCGMACIAGIGLSSLLQSCGTARQLSGRIVEDDLVVSLDSFSGGKDGVKQFVIVRNEILQYPICVYRHSENDYSALWMRCTHQGAELQVFGEVLQCPAHGSEFSSRGDVRGGPADNQLRSFPVTIANGQLKISLKAV
ncbi:MAG: Rieske (2Fe-2S) protein [Chitinophagaceae bacterium]